MELCIKTLKFILPAIILPPLLLTAVAVFNLPGNAFLSIAIIVLAMVPFFERFEKSRPRPRDMVPIAVMSAIAAIGRAVFAAVPNFKPVSAVVIITGMQFGAEAGFLTGALSALASNMFLGQGPWTPWQMYAWGMIGFTAGILQKKNWFRQRWVLYSYGLLSGILFGWFMNLQYIIGYMQNISVESVFIAYAGSFWFDLIHGVSTVIFLLLLERSWGKKLKRMKVKYGILKKEGENQCM